MSFEISENEIDFILGYLPPYCSLGESDSGVYLELIRRIAEHKESCNIRFRFPISDKTNQYKIEVIKLVRSFTGLGLKECKEAVESEMLFYLNQFKTKKEVIEYACGRATHPPITIEWLNH